MQAGGGHRKDHWAMGHRKFIDALNARPTYGNQLRPQLQPVIEKLGRKEVIREDFSEPRWSPFSLGRVQLTSFLNIWEMIASGRA